MKIQQLKSFYPRSTSLKHKDNWGEEKIKEANLQIRAQLANLVIKRAADECHGAGDKVQHIMFISHFSHAHTVHMESLYLSLF